MADNHNDSKLPESVIIAGIEHKISEVPELLNLVATISKMEKAKLYTQINNLKESVEQLKSLGVQEISESSLKESMSTLKEDAQQNDQRRRNGSSNHVFLVDQNTARKHRIKHENRVFRHADVDFVDVAAKQCLAQAFKEIGNSQRGHQQRGSFLVDQVAQHQALDQPGHDEHQHAGNRKRDQVGD